MKKIFIVLIAFLMLTLSSTYAGINTHIYAPKNEISDKKNQRKTKTIQKILSTKIGKFIVEKAIKKLQKKQLKNDLKTKKTTKNKRAIMIFSLGALLLIGGIVLLFAGYTLLGIILGVLGLAIIVTFLYLIWLISNAFSQYK